MTSVALAPNVGALNAEQLREDFPILRTQVHGKPLVYLDNAATTQKPQVVLDRIMEYYTSMNANIHRGVHRLSEISTIAYEKSRKTVQKFINAADHREIIFVRGCTEGMNLVAAAWGRANVKAGDEIVITGLEHHSNIVPWQLLCEATGAVLRVVPIQDNGDVLLADVQALLNEKTKLVSVSHTSNALGTVLPVKQITAAAKQVGAIVVIDGAQAVPHQPVDVQDIGCDFYAFSAHKVYGPTGIGVLYARAALQEAMPPYQGGGDMIASVTFEKTTYNEIPHKFEAGTPDICGVIALGTTLDYVSNIGLDRIAAHEATLVQRASAELAQIPGVKLIGTAPHKAGVVSFVIDGIHPHDIGTIVDRDGVAIRTGHHCAQPVMDRFGIPATARASFGLYNTEDDITALVASVKRVIEFFA